jgi:hypothetical protein
VKSQVSAGRLHNRSQRLGPAEHRRSRDRQHRHQRVAHPRWRLGSGTRATHANRSLNPLLPDRDTGGIGLAEQRLALATSMAAVVRRRTRTARITVHTRLTAATAANPDSPTNDSSNPVSRGRTTQRTQDRDASERPKLRLVRGSRVSCRGNDPTYSETGPSAFRDNRRAEYCEQWHPPTRKSEAMAAEGESEVFEPRDPPSPRWNWYARSD